MERQKGREEGRGKKYILFINRITDRGEIGDGRVYAAGTERQDFIADEQIPDACQVCERRRGKSTTSCPQH